MTRKKKKESFCGDMFISLVKNNKYFHWFKAYYWYSDLLVEDISSKHLTTVRLVKAGCMPEVFGVPKLVSWCSKCFDATKRIICVGGSTMPPINLIPLVFQKM